MGSFLSYSGEQSTEESHTEVLHTEVSHTEVSAEVESTERIMKIRVRECETERIIVLSVTEEQLKRITVLQLKKKIQSVFGIPVYTLTHGGLQLYDDELLIDHGIKDGSTINMNGSVLQSGRESIGMGDRESRNKSMDCVAIMWTGSDVSSESAPHPAAVGDLHKDSC